MWGECQEESEDECGDQCGDSFTVVLCSRISQESNRKEPLLLALVLDQSDQTLIHVKGHVSIFNRPCHCAGIQTDIAILQVYQSIRPSHCAGIFK